MNQREEDCGIGFTKSKFTSWVVSKSPKMLMTVFNLK